MRTEELLQAVAVAGRASCRASRRSCSRPTRSWRRRRACSPTQNDGGRAQEPRGRAGPAGAGGEGRAAGAHLQVQVRVPGQHVATSCARRSTACSSWPQQLADNPDGNLTDKQVEFAKTIHASGTDLLTLINDILDLSKIESGTMTRRRRRGRASPTCSDYVERTFRHVAESKEPRASTIELDPGAAARRCSTDAKRLQQVLKNLLSNAFKFTEKGAVTLRIGPASGGWSPDHADPQPRRRGDRLRGDATPASASPPTSSRSSSRPSSRPTAAPAASTAAPAWACPSAARSRGCWAARSGCESAPGEGSTFTLYLPAELRARAAARATSGRRPTALPAPAPRRRAGPRHRSPRGRAAGAARPAVPGHRAGRRARGLRRVHRRPRRASQPGDRVLLIVEDDVAFARFLLELAREKGFKAAGRHARRRRPGAGPRAASRRHHPRHRPARHRRLARARPAQGRPRHPPHPGPHHLGRGRAGARRCSRARSASCPSPRTRRRSDEAFDRMREFLDRRLKKLLVVEDDEVQRHSIVELIGNGDVRSRAVASGAGGAGGAVASEHFDCMVLDLRLPDMAGIELLEQIKKQPAAARRCPSSSTPARTSPEGGDRSSSGWPRPSSSRTCARPSGCSTRPRCSCTASRPTCPSPSAQILRAAAPRRTPLLAGKKVLVVDDDVRNIFALTSVLERHEMEVALRRERPGRPRACWRSTRTSTWC